MTTKAVKVGGSLAAREAAALTSRQWVRLTRCCNNRCGFCLDTDAQDGSMRPADKIVEEIQEGRRRGRQRLVLSGGEPTIHPDFLRFIRAGIESGYERVQVITNGRMFAQSDRLDAAREAGLGELTISVHGHTAELHDGLVGVKGAFVQTMRGLKNAVASQNLIVNVDIVVCGPNVAFIDRIVTLCERLGVREFDLLQVQPAGRAAQDDSMLYDVEHAMETLGKVFERSRRSDLFIWTNRFPIGYLEGYEELIQDPHKLVDEVRGRAEHIEALIETGRPLPCRVIEVGRLCTVCYLEPLCDELHELGRRLGRADFQEALVDLRSGPFRSAPSHLARSIRRSRVLARSLSSVREQLAPGDLAGHDVVLCLEDAEGLGDQPLELSRLPITRIATDRVDVLDSASFLGPDLKELEVWPDIDNESWLEAHLTLECPRLVLRPAPRSTLSQCLKRDIPPERLRDLLARSAAVVEDIPYCLAGGRPVTWSELALPPELVHGVSAQGIELFVERYGSTRYRAKSLRCRRCIDDSRCRGQQVQRLRAFGLRTLVPRS